MEVFQDFFKFWLTWCSGSGWNRYWHIGQKKTWTNHYSDWFGLNIWREEEKKEEKQGGRIDLKEVFSLTLYGSSPSLTVRASFSQVSLEWRVCTQSLKRNKIHFIYHIEILICGMGYGLWEVRQGPVWTGPLLTWIQCWLNAFWMYLKTDFNWKCEHCLTNTNIRCNPKIQVLSIGKH